MSMVLGFSPDEHGEAFFQTAIAEWNGRGIPSWMPDGGHECFAWDRLLRMGFSGLEDFVQQELERRITGSLGRRYAGRRDRRFYR